MLDVVDESARKKVWVHFKNFYVCKAGSVNYRGMNY